MESAKDKLAHYRKQGFGDELIEMLVMQEDDQTFAEELLDALIEELEEKQEGSDIDNNEALSLKVNENIEIPVGFFY